MIDANYREKMYLDCIFVNWNTLALQRFDEKCQERT
jgi:hypothetical protein